MFGLEEDGNSNVGGGEKLPRRDRREEKDIVVYYSVFFSRSLAYKSCDGFFCLRTWFLIIFLFPGRACVSNVDRGSFFPFSIHKCDNLLQPQERKQQQQQQQQNIFKSLSSFAKSRFKITDFST